MGTVDDEVIFRARAAVLADLEARGLATPVSVSLLDEACAERRWWVQQWAEGAAFVPGLVAQDLQDALADRLGRSDPAGLWPVCRHCDEGPVHALHIDPDLGGPDPVWVCEESGTTIAPLGTLATHGG
ncbi:hypothetical protein [Nocardioides sp. YIM 152588]|uniref:hypothetical protein n=1 Tax=Nocardioides sp. YIM 152588 TaxID=3158259 RepID=UPI0032E525D5